MSTPSPVTQVIGNWHNVTTGPTLQQQVALDTRVLEPTIGYAGLPYTAANEFASDSVRMAEWCQKARINHQFPNTLDWDNPMNSLEWYFKDCTRPEAVKEIDCLLYFAILETRIRDITKDKPSFFTEGDDLKLLHDEFTSSVEIQDAFISLRNMMTVGYETDLENPEKRSQTIKRIKEMINNQLWILRSGYPDTSLLLAYLDQKERNPASFSGSLPKMDKLSEEDRALLHELGGVYTSIASGYEKGANEASMRLGIAQMVGHVWKVRKYDQGISLCRLAEQGIYTIKQRESLRSRVGRLANTCQADICVFRCWPYDSTPNLTSLVTWLVNQTQICIATMCGEIKLLDMGWTINQMVLDITSPAAVNCVLEIPFPTFGFAVTQKDTQVFVCKATKDAQEAQPHYRVRKYQDFGKPLSDVGCFFQFYDFLRKQRDWFYKEQLPKIQEIITDADRLDRLIRNFKYVGSDEGIQQWRTVDVATPAGNPLHTMHPIGSRPCTATGTPSMGPNMGSMGPPSSATDGGRGSSGTTGGYYMQQPRGTSGLDLHLYEPPIWQGDLDVPPLTLDLPMPWHPDVLDRALLDANGRRSKRSAGWEDESAWEDESSPQKLRYLGKTEIGGQEMVC